MTSLQKESWEDKFDRQFGIAFGLSDTLKSFILQIREEAIHEGRRLERKKIGNAILKSSYGFNPSK